mmetsp:Transcript_9157/g.17065  ORF Transcript_9157/g.17065 Transcript_9157/m.17065 type:complete len:201 (+) Transcript_9157:424-1026(+)
MLGSTALQVELLDARSSSTADTWLAVALGIAQIGCEQLNGQPAILRGGLRTAALCQRLSAACGMLLHLCAVGPICSIRCRRASSISDAACSHVPTRNVPGQSRVLPRVLLIAHQEDDVEAAEQGLGHDTLQVLSKREAHVPTPLTGIRCRHHRCACRQSADDACLSDGHRLLLHCLQERLLVCAHLVKFIYAAQTIVCKN